MNKIKTKKGRRKGAAAGCWTLGIRFLIRVACVRIFHYRGNGNTITTKVSRSKIDYLHGNKTFCCMGRINVRHVILIIGIGSLYSCSVIEKSSRHGFDSGYYNQSLEKGPSEKVYLDITDEQVAVYPVVENKPGKLEMTLPLGETDSLYVSPSRFSKKSLDIDITTIFFKYRPATDELQAQLTAELNVALYAGWRHDFYRIEGKKDPLGEKNYTIVKRGFDFGVLAGPGTTFIGPSTTKTSITKEYNGMILEYGFAAFLETNFASFGLATGFDYLLNSDRSVWIYNKKPWVGFVVGIALN